MDSRPNFMSLKCVIALIILWRTGVLSLGYLTPRGSVYKYIGDDVEIYCTMDLTKYKDLNSSHLWFYKENIRESPENIRIINETTILLKIRNAPQMNVNYACKVNNNSGIDMIAVYVGTPPTNVTDFKCRSYDYDYFLCIITTPQNGVAVSYSLQYRIEYTTYPCPLQRLDTDRNKLLCNITLDKAVYRQVHEYYEFILKADNRFGNTTQKFLINHFNNVIPAKPESMNATNITSHSAELEWKIAKKTAYQEKGLTYELKIMSHYSQDWQLYILDGEKIANEKNIYSFVINDLEYAFTWYDVRLRVKVTTAENIEEMWSDIANLTFRTPSKRPDKAPAIDIGSFHFDDNGNIHLYWKVLEKFEENGPELDYVITEIRQNGVEKYIKPVEKSLTTAKFQLPLADYEFTLQTKNSKGLSVAKNILKVPKNGIVAPINIKKIYTESQYTLRWSAPENNSHIINYTIFWCVRRGETSNQCEGSIDFTHVDKHTRSITHPSDNISNFAISANSRNSSSGMVWAMCTAQQDSDFSKMNLKARNINATIVKLEWNLECIYQSILKGYHLVYCPYSDPKTMNCTQPQVNITIPEDAKEYYITGLTPYTSYKIIISMFSDTKHSPPSDPFSISTVEAAPTPPRRLTYSNVTNTSVILTWSAPLHFNGALRYYEIIYNNEKIRVEDSDLLKKNEIFYTLNMLRSFTKYKIYVIATTVANSEASNDIEITTAVGTPGSIDQPNPAEEDSKMRIYWSAPKEPFGRIEFYEFKAVIHKDNAVVDIIKLINGTSCSLKNPVCGTKSQKYEFFVRAVNVEEIKNHQHSHSHSRRDSNLAMHYLSLENSDIAHETSTSNILKRHSNPEIDSHVSEQHSVHRSNSVRHYRQERDFNKQITTMDRNDDSQLECEEEHDENLKKWLTENHQSLHFLRGDWSKPSIHFCHYGTDNTAALFIGVCLAIATIGLCVYFVFNKVNRMKDIKSTMPFGLTDQCEDNKMKGFDNIISKDNFNRSDESLCRNEEHHLLDTRNDSGCIVPSEKLDDDTISEKVREEDNSGPTDSVELSDISDNSNVSPVHMSSINLRPNPNNEKSISSFTVNGYVQPQAFQMPKPTLSTDYIQLDASNKPIIPKHLSTVDSSVKHKNTHEPEKVICGYVTHKQLSDFAQRQH